MNDKSRKVFKKKCCLIISLLLIVSGCSTYNKKSKLLAVQQKRIVKLENQLKQKQKQIDHFKVNKWVNEPTLSKNKTTFASLKKMMTERKWIEALKLSAQLKKQHPKSVKLAQYRSLIFNKMGLLSQERSERRLILNLKAQRLSDQASKIK